MATRCSIQLNLKQGSCMNYQDWQKKKQLDYEHSIRLGLVSGIIAAIIYFLVR